MTPKSNTVDRLLTRLGLLQGRAPVAFIVLAFLLGAAALPLVARLELNSDFRALLPERAQSVRDLHEIQRRFGGTATLSLAFQAREGATIEQLREDVRDAVPALEALEPLGVAAVDWNLSEFETFVTEHRHLYAERSDLEEIRDSLQARVDYERAHANPFYIDLGDEVPPSPEEVIARIERDAQQARGEMERFPEGFYQHPTEPIIFVFLRTNLQGGDTGRVQTLLAAIQDRLADAMHEAPSARRVDGSDVGVVFQHLRVDFGGDVMDVLEENDALRDAVELSTLITAVLLLASIYLFFFRWRAALLLGLTLIPPCLITFGLAEPVIDYLNASTAFLGSIVVGNGVNSSVMWLGRYFEERRDGKAVPEAIVSTHLGTWSGTLAAALGAGLAYASLMVTDYRGFRDFGLVGLLGMSFCWLAAYLLLPSLAAFTERLRPLVFTAKENERKGIYGVLFAKLALGGASSKSPKSSAPKWVLFASALVTVLALVAIARVAMTEPLEYDFRRLQSVRSNGSRVMWVNNHIGETIEETQTGSALAILAPTVDDVPSVVAQLETYRQEHPDVLGATRTIDDLMPHDVEAKLPVLAELRALLLEIRPHLTEAQQAQVDEHLPPADLQPFTREALPLCVARAFMERDGTRGRVVFVEHADGQSTWDGRYMIAWARGVRSVHLGEARPAIAGIAVVFADLLESLYSDVPKAIGLALAATILLLLVSFRRGQDRALSFFSMVLGTLWMTGLLAGFGIKLNFLNIVAFPITFGIGLEYAVNYVKRYREEVELGKGDIDAARAALEGAGGAVILCSLTTLIGYLSLFVSTNQALNSFGFAMSASEITCLGAAVLSVPSLIAFLASRSKPRPE
jgi:predicted RND superfamily exporter protein